MAAIEYRSYNAGTAIIEATSGNLTPATLTITVLHESDNLTVASLAPGVLHNVNGPSEMVVAGWGSRIALPRSVAGKKVAVSLFDMRGRLIDFRIVNRTNILVRRDAAEGIVIAKVKVVK